MSDVAKPVVQFENDEWENQVQEQWKQLDGGDDSVIEFLTPEQASSTAEEERPEVPAADELMERIKALEAENQNLSSRADGTAQLKEAVLGLSQRLQPQEAAAPPEPDWDKLNERFREDIMGDRPLDALSRAVQQVIGGDIRTIADNIQALRSQTMVADPKWGGIYSRYKGEVDAAVARRPDRYANVNAVLEETERVAAKHIEEIVKEQVDAALKERERPRGPNGQFTEVGRTNNPPQRPRKRVVMTPELEKMRLNKGMPPEAFYAWAERRGLLK